MQVYRGTDMTAENFDSVLQVYLNRRPFHLFTIELNGGDRFEIDHPQSVVYREGVAVFIGPGRKIIWFDHESVNKIIEGQVESLQA